MAPASPGMEPCDSFGLFTLFVVHAHMVFSNIAQYEAQGLVVDNDLGQRGLALSGVFVLVTSVLALLSIRYLVRASVLGFVLHAVLWFAVLLLGMGIWLVFAWEPGGAGIGLLLLCLTGIGYGVLCARTDTRLQKYGPVAPWMRASLFYRLGGGSLIGTKTTSGTAQRICSSRRSMAVSGCARSRIRTRGWRLTFPKIRMSPEWEASRRMLLMKKPWRGLSASDSATSKGRVFPSR